MEIKPYRSIQEMLDNYHNLVHGLENSKQSFETPEHLFYMLNELEFWTEEVWIKDKLRTVKIDNYGKFCRWVGYVQGILYSKGALCIHVERSRTRDLFEWLDIPGNRLGS